VAGIDVGVDTGFKLERVPAGTTAGRKKWFGSYRTDHTYYLIVTGTGAAMSLKMVALAGTAGTGGVTVSILRLSPYPPTLPGLLESLKAPSPTKPYVLRSPRTHRASIYCRRLARANAAATIWASAMPIGWTGT